MEEEKWRMDDEFKNYFLFVDVDLFDLKKNMKWLMIENIDWEYLLEINDLVIWKEKLRKLYLVLIKDFGVDGKMIVYKIRNYIIRRNFYVKVVVYNLLK